MFFGQFLLRRTLCTIFHAPKRVATCMNFQQFHRTSLHRIPPSTANLCYSTDSGNVPFNLKEANIDEETRTQINYLILELSLLQLEGQKVCEPESVTLNQWKHILSLRSRNARIKEYKYLGTRIYERSIQIQKRAERQAAQKVHIDTQRESRQKNPHIVYGLGYTSLLLHISSTKTDIIRNNRLWRAKMLGEQKIIFDCSFDETMTKKIASSVSRQMITASGNNRRTTRPFDIHICNLDSQTKLAKHLLHNMPNILQSPLECHEECFTKLYPKDNFIYLTPYSPNVLREYNPADTYIIGGLIEKNYASDAANSRAKQLGIRSAWFPVNKYLNWGSADKGIPLNITIDILLEFKNSRDWRNALKCTPKRKSVIKRASRSLAHATGSKAMFGLRREIPGISNQHANSELPQSPAEQGLQRNYNESDDSNNDTRSYMK